MFKNSKILKGITLVLALVLVLGAGILVGSYVDAASKTVLFYVSDHGDNSTGEDEATAFTSIDAAIAAADKMYLEPGSQLKLLVVDRVSVPTQKVDELVLRDRNGARVPIIITSHQNVTDEEDFSEVYFTYFTDDPTLPASSQKAVFYNDITFKNIRLNAQAQDVFSSDGDSKGYYCVRRLYFNGEKITLDNVQLTNEDSLQKAKWNIYPGGDTATEEYLNKEINFLNGDYYSKSTVCYVSNGNNPNTNYEFNVENAKMNYIYVVGGNANKIDVNFKNKANIYALYYSAGATKNVPGDVTINYEKGSVLQNAWGSEDSSECNFNLIQNVYGTITSGTQMGPKGDINGDMINNFYEGCTVGGAVTFGKYGGVSGTLLTNVYGGTFNSSLTVGKSEKTTKAGMSNRINRIVTNIEGGLFKGAVTLAPNVDGNLVGNVINTIGKATFNGNVACAGCSHIENDLQFYINGATIKGDLRSVNGSSSAKRGIGGDAYVKITSLSMPTSGKMFRAYQNMGTIGGNSTFIFDTTDSASNSIDIVGGVDLSFGESSQAANDCLVYVDGGASKSVTFGGAFNGGIAVKRVINTIKNCTFKNVYNGMRDTGTEYLENNMENVTFKNTFNGSVSNNALGGNYGTIVNYLKGCTLEKAYYGAGGGAAGKIVGNVTNIFENTTTKNTLYMGGNGTNKFDITGNITNYFKDSDLAAVTYCGSANGDVLGSIKTTFIGGSQGNTFYGGNGSGGTVSGSITNVFDSVEVKKGGVAGGSKAGTVGGDISTTLTNCDLKGGITGSVSSGVTFTGAVSLTINGGAYEGRISVCEFVAKAKSVDVEINGGTFNGCQIVVISGPCIVEGDVTFTVTAGNFIAASTEPYFRVLRPKSTTAGDNMIKGDLICTFDTTASPVNEIKSTGLFEVSMGYNKILGDCILTVDGGANSAIELEALGGAMCDGTAVNNVKNAKLGGFRGSRNNSAATPCENLINNFENVEIKDYYNGASISSSSLTVVYTGKVTNNLKNVIVGGTFYGGAANTKDSSIGSIENNITDCIFEKGYYGAGYGTVPGDVVNNIYGAEFKGAIYPSFSTAKGAAVQFNLIPTAAPIVINGSLKALASLEKISLKGGEQPIVLDADASVVLDEYDGAAQRFVQSVSWTAGQTYVTFPASSELSKITIFNASSDVTGNGVVDGNVIKGDGIAATAPALKSVSFHVGDALGVRFWADKAEVEAWIASNGSWSYSINFMGSQIQGATFTSIDQFKTEDLRGENDEYVTFLADLEITSILYGEKITVALSGGISNDYTVYQILDLGVNYYKTTKPELSTLMMAIYNYGAEAYNVLCEGNVDVKYASQVPAPQDYTGSASATGSAGYEFYATGISLDSKVTLNYYLKAADLSQLSFTATNSKGVALPASAISVKAVEGVAEYNAVISLKLTIPQMAEIYTLSAKIGSAEVATCTNSVTYSCMTYINPQGSTPAIYAPVAKALLAFIEASLAVAA